MCSRLAPPAPLGIVAPSTDGPPAMIENTTAAEDPFLLAWGEVGAWRGVQAQASLVSILPQTLLTWNAQGVFQVAHAIGQSQSLRHHLVEEIDRLVATMGLPWLHRAMEDLRAGNRGWIRKWRRHCIKRAVSYCLVVDQEHKQMSLARVQLEAWVRSLDCALVGLRNQREWMDGVSDLPVEHRKEFDEFQKMLMASVESVDLLRNHLLKLLAGVECLRAKARLFDELCNAVPNHEDILNSETFRVILAELLAVPPSCIPISKE